MTVEELIRFKHELNQDIQYGYDLNAKQVEELDKCGNVMRKTERSNEDERKRYNLG